MRSQQKGRGTQEKSSKSNYAFYGIFALVTYFIWCDLGFFGELTVQKTRAFVFTNTTVLEHKTIKLRMQDHFGHYIYIPFCEWLDKNLGISKIPGISPNVITAIHLFIAVISGRLVASTSFFWRRVGVLLYELRTLLDALDGVVYRAQSSSREYLSGWGTYGYMIDGMADTIGGLFIMAGTIYRLNKHLPFKNPELAAKLKHKKHGYDPESAERLLSDDSCSDDLSDEPYGLKRYSRQAVNFSIVCYTFAVFFRSALWDHFNHGYHDLLSKPRLDISPVSTIYSFCLFCFSILSILFK